jgi:hypothetical protein
MVKLSLKHRLWWRLNLCVDELKAEGDWEVYKSILVSNLMIMPKSAALDMKISYILNVQAVTYVWVTKKSRKRDTVATSTRLFKEELWKILKVKRRIFTFINTCCCIVYNLR